MSLKDTLTHLTGAHVRKAWREGIWLCLDTDKGLVNVAAGRVRMDLECPRCNEYRLVELVADGRGEQGVCAVCAHNWWIEAEPEHVGPGAYVIPDIAKR